MKKALAYAGAACLFLLAFITTMGAIKLFKHPEKGGSAADWIVPAVMAVVCASGGGALYRYIGGSVSDLIRRPGFQAPLLYAAALPLMLVLPGEAYLFAFLGFLAFSIAAPLSTLLRPRWLTAAGAAVVGAALLFVAGNETAELVRGYPAREGMMVYLLPLQILGILLIVSGIVRLRRARKARPVGGDEPLER